MAPTGRRGYVFRFHATPSKPASINSLKKFQRDPTVVSIDTDHLTRYSVPVGGMAPTGRLGHVLPIPRDSTEKSLRKLMKKMKRDPTVGSIDTNLLSRFSCGVGGKAAIGRRRRVIPIQSYSIGNSLRKIVKKF